jgi:gliding motility-associated-like protein
MKTKFLLIIALAFCGITNAQTLPFSWGRGSAGMVHDEGRKVATDAQGNAYITGEFQSPVITFGAFTLTNPSGVQVFLVKYDSTGSVLWARSSLSSGGRGFNVATDLSGNVFVTGTFNSAITFGSYTLSNGGVFLVKYDSNGNVLWAKQAGAINDCGFAVATDASGNVCVTGSFYNTSIIFGTDTLTNAGGGDYDIFLAKYDASGNVLWAKGAGSLAGDYGYGVATDASGNIFITGQIGPPVTFGSFTLGASDFFLVKYDGNGNVIWAKDNAALNIGQSVATDGFGNIYVRTDGYLVKYNFFGNVVWTIPLPGIGYSVATDNSINVYVTGAALPAGSPFTIGSYTFSFSSPVDPMYVTKFDSSGALLCAAALVSGGDDQSGVAADAFGNAYIGGDYMDQANPFVVGPDTLPPAGMESIFIAKYRCNACSEVTAISTDALCTGQCTGTAAATVTGVSAPYTYSWSTVPVQTTQTATGLCAGIYNVTVTDANSCAVTATTVVNATAGPTANAGTDVTISFGNSVTLTATGGGTYLWSNGDTTPSITVTPLVTTEYCVTVTDANQCTDTACVKVFVEIPCPTNADLSVPNAFSPNNDGNNDDFCLRGWNICIKNFNIHIYDRWGEKVFESKDSAFCWDGTYKGKLMDAAVFVYYIEAQLTTSEEVIRKGNISLIR